MARKCQPEAETRPVRGRAQAEARFPVAPSQAALPEDYAAALAAIKSRIQEERLRVVLSANAAMVLLYWDIGQMILARQARAGWGAKVIDRLAADLREAFPDMKGFSPRNLKYMRAFAAAWPERAIVQEPLARLPWYHHEADRRRRLGDQARREAAEGAGRQPAERRGGRGGAVREAEAEGEGEEVVRRGEAAKLDAAIAANLKELGYGG